MNDNSKFKVIYTGALVMERRISEENDLADRIVQDGLDFCELYWCTILRSVHTVSYFCSQIAWMIEVTSKQVKQKPVVIRCEFKIDF